MACNCSKKKDQDCTYIYTDSKGQQLMYSSEIRAMAAKVKDNHQGSIRVECK